MPISINELLTSAGLNTNQLKTVQWGRPIDTSSIGIYIISTSLNPDSNSNLFDNSPVDESVLDFWIKKVKTIQINGRPASVGELKQQLNSFWLPDENIIYIGQTESSKGLRGRVNQYYRTELGDRKPHAGGHWIKTLKILNELFVHYIPTQNPMDVEKKLMQNFISQVSDKTKIKLIDPTLHLPFANLELEKGNRKNHGISKSKLGDLNRLN